MGLCNKTNMHSPIDLQFTLSSNTFSSSVNYNAIPELYKYYVNVLYFSGCYIFKNEAGCLIVFKRTTNCFQGEACGQQRRFATFRFRGAYAILR